MSNIKQYRICADVPFSWVTDMDAKDVQRIASLTMGPFDSEGELSYDDKSWYVPSGSGQCSMHRLWVEGESGCSFRCLEAVCHSLLKLQHSILHIAEAKDVQWESEDNEWEYVISAYALSGEAEAVPAP